MPTLIANLFSCRQILAFEDEQVFQLNIVAFNNATDGDHYCNMQVVDLQVVLSSGTMKVVFLNKFVNSLLVSAVIYIYIFFYNIFIYMYGPFTFTSGSQD